MAASEGLARAVPEGPCCRVRGTAPAGSPVGLEIGRNSSRERVIGHRHGMPREAAQSPSLEVLKERVGVALSATVGVTRWGWVTG